MHKNISDSLSDSRIQLHWASQVLSSAADAALEKAADDSHSNLGWDADQKRIVGRVGACIDVVEFLLIHDNDSFQLRKSKLSDAMSWLGERLQQQLSPREYDMPDHAVASGAPMDPKPGDLIEIANWFDFGSTAMKDQGELRIWPHHFDLGFFMPNVSGEKSIGGGFSIGDDHYEMPYIYVNPYGIDSPNSLPAIAPGFWTDKWLGAVITFEEFGKDDGLQLATKFTKDAVDVCKGLLRDGSSEG